MDLCAQLTHTISDEEYTLLLQAKAYQEQEMERQERNAIINGICYKLEVGDDTEIDPGTLGDLFEALSLSTLKIIKAELGIL